MSFLLNLLGGISKKEHQAELDKMKKLYHEQIDEIQTAFQKKQPALSRILSSIRRRTIQRRWQLPMRRSLIR